MQRSANTRTGNQLTPRSMVVRATVILVAMLLTAMTGCSADSPVATPSTSRSNPSTASRLSGQEWQGTDLLWDVARGDRDFVAVGNSGVIVTSADGSAWMLQPSATAQTLRGVGFGGGRFVAVGTGGTILSWDESADVRSTSPASPTLRESGTTKPLLGVARGANGWVVAGSGGLILTSPDLERWAQASSHTTGDLFAVARGAGTIVAVADDGSIVAATEAAPTEWSLVRPADGVWLWDVTYGNGQFVATGAGGAVLSSPDGRAWTQGAAPTTQALRGVAFGDGQFVVSGSDNTIMSSPDGRQWTSHPAEEGTEYWRPAFGGATWVVVGAGGTRLNSADFITWKGTHTTRTAFYGVGSNPDRTLATGVGGVVARRRDDGSWTMLARAPERREMRSVSWLGGVWVATGGGGTIMTSTDGDQFVPRASGSSAELWSGAISDTGRLIVVGAGGAILGSDDRGASWQTIKAPNKSTYFSVAFGPAGFVAVGVDGARVQSRDGITWRDVSGTGEESRVTLRAVGGDERNYVAVGVDGAIRNSTDGATWTSVASPTTVTLRAVAKVGDSWLAVGGGGTVLRSTDSLNWTDQPSGTTEELFALTATTAGDIARRAAILAVGGVDSSIVSFDAGLTWTK